MDNLKNFFIRALLFLFFTTGFYLNYDLSITDPEIFHKFGIQSNIASLSFFQKIEISFMYTVFDFIFFLFFILLKLTGYCSSVTGDACREALNLLHRYDGGYISLGTIIAWCSMIAIWFIDREGKIREEIKEKIKAEIEIKEIQDACKNYKYDLLNETEPKKSPKETVLKTYGFYVKTKHGALQMQIRAINKKVAREKIENQYGAENIIS